MFVKAITLTVNWKASLVGQILVSFTGQVISRRTQLDMASEPLHMGMIIDSSCEH